MCPAVQKHIASNEQPTSAKKGEHGLTPGEMFKDTNRTFDFRLNSTHSDPDNTLATLHVEHLVNHTWQTFPLDVDAQTRGFSFFVCSCFIDQHTCLQENITEQELELAFISGTFKMTTSYDWHILAITSDFNAYLSAGHADRGKVNYFIEQMKECLVSRKLGNHVVTQTNLTIHGEPNDLHVPDGFNTVPHVFQKQARHMSQNSD